MRCGRERDREKQDRGCDVSSQTWENPKGEKKVKPRPNAKEKGGGKNHKSQKSGRAVKKTAPPPEGIKGTSCGILSKRFRKRGRSGLQSHWKVGGNGGHKGKGARRNDLESSGGRIQPSHED